jgi:DDE superfamily endonuclease/Winged helix-turn helix
MKRRIVLSRRDRARLEAEAAGCSDGALRTRLLIIIHSAEGWGRPQIATALRCDMTTVSRVRARWLEARRRGLTDRRAFNGRTKADDEFAATVRWVLEHTPIDFCHRRPTWTQPLLIQTAHQYTGVAVSTTTMSRVLRGLKARLGRPKPVAPCPWSEAAQKARMRMIHRLLETLPLGEEAYWEDEVDIDLNPKIGRDWMLPGTQRRVMTPGQNVKRYAAIALNARSGGLRWTTAKRKNSDLFIALLGRLDRAHPSAAKVHLILDNYGIHTSKATRVFLERHPRLRLHFLPPYCPDDNRIEREVCRELHANVTVNHTHSDIDDLMEAVHAYLAGRNRRAVAESRIAI